jgi:ABC-type multidrug transport system ATPase subunit
LELDSVELEYDGKKILYGIYIKAQRGEVTGILGRNGSGKTSLLRILFGDLQPKYKNIRSNGKCLPKPLYRSGKIGYLPQHALLPRQLVVKRAFELCNVSWQQFIIHFQSFEEYYKARIKDLSSGEIRVLEAYLILFSNKGIILLDEPFSFIAPIYVEKFKSIIHQVKKKSIVILTDHFYNDILAVSDTVYLIKNGCSKIIGNENKKFLETDYPRGKP